MKQRRVPNEPAKILTRDHLRRIAAVAHARDLGFVELVGLAELDPASAFRGAIIRGADLRGQDLSGFDLTGARLIDCRTAGLDLSRVQGVTDATVAGSERDDTVRLPPTLRAAFWASGVPPSWAEDWGRDRHGPWVSFCVPGTDVRQRMRWIPPGEFMMGSPEGERGHWEVERPLHQVKIAHGFWMFETTCTEALWEALCAPMFTTRGLTFPATDVSWNDAQDFVLRLNKALPGIALELPSEARWEYACRAGSSTPYHFGKRISHKHVRYNKDYGDGPVEAGTFAPNAWGLHEMHGNVWEWCEDDWHPDYSGAPDDGSAWTDPRARAAGRVIRGGSWGGDARYVRAAFRYWREPGGRLENLGFRCARGLSEKPAECAPREAGRGKQGARAPRRPRPASRGAPTNGTEHPEAGAPRERSPEAPFG